MEQDKNITPAKKTTEQLSWIVNKEQHLYAHLESHIWNQVSCILQKQYNRSTYWNSASLFYIIYVIFITEVA